jgi:L-malate glycosyltransferase
VTPLRILHCHSTFALGGKEARAVRLMNAFGDAARHTILSATPDLVARDAIDPAIAVDFPSAAPSLTGKPSPGRYRALARYMAGFDLVLTYNWGSMDAVGARRLFPQRVPPLIHHEDGFNADEADRLNWKRNAFRRLVLPTAHALVVPSHVLERVAKTAWGAQLPIWRISNGIAVARYDMPEPGAIPGFERGDSDVVVGTVAGLRAVKNLPRLVEALALTPPHVRLVIVGEGPERAHILAMAARLGLADRVMLPGFLPEPHRYVGLFDIMALSSLSEQQPIAVMEAMAAGLPVVATDVGDIASMVSAANRDAMIGGALAFENLLVEVAASGSLRRTFGAANRIKAQAEFDEAQMITAYARLYADAAGISPQQLWPGA